MPELAELFVFAERHLVNLHDRERDSTAAGKQRERELSLVSSTLLWSKQFACFEGSRLEEARACEVLPLPLEGEVGRELHSAVVINKALCEASVRNLVL